MTSLRVPSQSAQLAVSVWGDGGVPVLALHPGVGDSRIWQWCAPTWADAGHRVVAYDRRGFGATTYAAENHDTLADLLAVTDATNAKPAVVVGNSMGGGLAIDLTLAHPEDVRALVLIAPSPSGYDYTTWQASEAETAEDERLEAAEASGDLDLVNRIEVRYWLDGVDQTEGRVSGSARELLAEMNRRALKAEPIGESANHPAAWPNLENINAPTLVIAGEHDLPGAIQMCRDIVGLIPDCEYVLLSDTAHCPSLDQPAQLSAVILDFLRRRT